MAGGIGNDEFALVGREVAVSYVNRNPLFPLGLQSVEQQGIVDCSPLCADLLAVHLQRRQLVLEHHLRIPEQAPDECALAVINAAAGDEAQQRFFFLAFEIGENILLNQF